MQRRISIAIASLLSITLLTPLSALTPNHLISKGKTVKSSSASMLSSVTDGKFSGNGWSISANSWIAINVGKGPSKVFLMWDSPMQIWSDSVALPLAVGKSCWQTVNMPLEYTILTSDSSTTGDDGQWTEAVSVTNNVVAGRGHLVDFTGKSWIKMRISKGTGQIDEIGVFDASNGMEDSWIFIGTSISQMAFRSNLPANSFCDLVCAKTDSIFTPAIIRGGIGCIFSANLADDVSKYLANAGNVHFWAIEMGTNDAWDKLDVAIYKANLQRVIDSCKAHHIEPVISRLIATDSTKVKWQVTPEYLAAIDSLTSKNGLFPGPDFYTYFRQHPGELNNDGVHPNATGGASMQRLWAEAMSPLYASDRIEERRKGTARTGAFDAGISVTAKNGRMVLKSRSDGRAEVFDIRGTRICKKDMTARQSAAFLVGNGFYIIRIANDNGFPTKPVVVPITR